MLKLGERNISALYLGGKKIKKAYLGETVLFVAGKPSRLPEGYTEVEYIESTGPQYIDTLQKPAVTLKVTMDVQPLTENSSAYGGLFIASFAGKIGSYYYSNSINWSRGINGLMGRYTTAMYTRISANGTPRKVSLEMDWPNKTIAVDGVPVSFSTNNVASAAPSLTMLKASQSGTTDYYLAARLYSCQMYLSDEAVRDFVPCVDPAGAVGLYDLVEGKFYGNAGTGAFIAGPAV